MTQQMPTSSHQLPPARFLAAITTSGAAHAAAQRLDAALEGRTYLLLNAAAPSEPDDGTDVQPDRAHKRPAPPTGFKVMVTATRAYEPRGMTLTALQALRTHGPLTAAGLHRVAGLPPKAIVSLLEAPVAHGLVRRVEGRPIVWELA